MVGSEVGDFHWFSDTYWSQQVYKRWREWRRRPERGTAINQTGVLRDAGAVTGPTGVDWLQTFLVSRVVPWHR